LQPIAITFRQRAEDAREKHNKEKHNKEKHNKTEDEAPERPAPRRKLQVSSTAWAKKMKPRPVT
jgi:hypothetical protein